MEFTGTKCDGCGRVKGEANKWLASYVALESIESKDAIVITRWEDRRRYDKSWCGQGCLLKWLEPLLAEMQAAKGNNT